MEGEYFGKLVLDQEFGGQQPPHPETTATIWAAPISMEPEALGR
jgi:hypothetical protein